MSDTNELSGALVGLGLASERRRIPFVKRSHASMGFLFKG